MLNIQMCNKSGVLSWWRKWNKNLNLSAFKENYGKNPNWEAAQSYDAVKVLAKAIQKAGSVKVEDIAEVLKTEEKWDECAGPYRFNENGDIEKQLFIKKSSNGEFKLLSK